MSTCEVILRSHEGKETDNPIMPGKDNHAIVSCRYDHPGHHFIMQFFCKSSFHLNALFTVLSTDLVKANPAESNHGRTGKYQIDASSMNRARDSKK